MQQPQSQEQQQQQQQQQPQQDVVSGVFSRTRSRWYTNEEVASILTSFSNHPEWQTNELQVRPKSGAVLLYSREKVRYRQDGYCWKKRKNGRTTREDHMKLKVQGIECIYGCYVHSAILPTFHRRCYWLLQNPDTVLVHYLNQPPDDQNKMMLTFNSSLLEADTRRSWTNEEIIEEIGSVFGGISEIHHTLSINFPQPTTQFIQERHQHQQLQNQQQQQQLNSCQQEDKMIDSSPQSQATPNTEPMKEQVEDMAVTGNQQQNHNATCSNEVPHLSQNKDLNNNDNQSNQGLNDDEMMAISQESNSDQTTSVNSLDRGGHQTNGIAHSQLIQQQQHASDDGAISMTFDIVNECRDDNHGSNLNNQGQDQSAVCYDFVSNRPIDNINMDNLNVVRVDDNSNNVLNDSDNLCTPASGSSQMDQSPCSPVTQIYNKIVDDIETYALPLEPNQFDSNHHHHHHHDHHHHHHHGISLSSSLPIQPMDIGDKQDNRQASHHNHHNNQQQRVNALQHQNQSQGLSSQEQETGITNVQYIGRHDTNDLNHDQSDCSVDLTSCDLFGDCDLSEMERGNGRDTSVESGNNSNLLLTEFNLTGNRNNQSVNDDFGSSVVDTLRNADDLRDLMIGMPAPGNELGGHTDQNSNLIVDSNSLDLFNFKPSSCEPTQLDVKSTTSDTDTMNRLSPMAPLVPRCNSTDNAMQPSQRLDQYQHHLSSHFLTNAPQDALINNTFGEYNHNVNSHRSTANSTDPSNSTSCSPSPSSSSLVTTGHPSSTRSAYLDGSSQCSTGSSSNSFIKLPLQQRQKSEQKEPSNNVLNSLLPKALSLDGSDLSNSNHLRGTSSPLVGSFGNRGDTARHCRNLCHQNLLPIPPGSASSSEHHHSGNHYYQRPSAPSLSPSAIPIESSNKMLVSGQAISYRSGSVLASNICQQQIGTMECVKLQQATVTSGRLLPILDYVPNWSISTGGTKILLIGNWTGLVSDKQQLGNKEGTVETGSGFFAVFDDLAVPATLIQDNVLRCHAPARAPGFITLKVLYMNLIVSEQVLFEMRAPVSCVPSLADSSMA